MLRHMGFGRFPGNPAICTELHPGFSKTGMTGAEIPVTLLFADVRGSTAHRRAPDAARVPRLSGRFYAIGSKAILDHDGLVDKLVGDEIIGLFFGGVSGPDHAAAAIAAGPDLARAGRPDATPQRPIPLGGAVHTGTAYVGPTGPAGAVDDFTALGDVVNTTARLASAAAAGELLVSVAAAEAAGDVASDGGAPDARDPRPRGDDRRRTSCGRGLNGRVASERSESRSAADDLAPPLEQDYVAPTTAGVLAHACWMPTRRNPTARGGRGSPCCRRATPARSVQSPAASEAGISVSRRARPTPRPRASSAT